MCVGVQRKAACSFAHGRVGAQHEKIMSSAGIARPPTKRNGNTALHEAAIVTGSHVAVRLRIACPDESCFCPSPENSEIPSRVQSPLLRLFQTPRVFVIRQLCELTRIHM